MKTLAALSLILAVIAASAFPADAHKRKHKSWHGSDHYSAKRVKPQVRGYVSRGGGGQSYEYALTPFLYRNGPYGNYPYFDDRNFWERVQSGPLSETTSPSGF